MKIALQTLVSALLGVLFFMVLLFAPAGTLGYWQAWVFIAVFVVVTTVPSVYLAVKRPEVLQRRMRAGPMAESRPVQKFASAGAFVAFVAMSVLSAFDHRFAWSTVPPAVSVVGNVLVAVGLGASMLVVIQNSYAAANITVEAGQTVVSSGLYGIVRHPMYAGAVIMMVGLPLALGSYWGLVVLVPGIIVLAVRIHDEEDMLVNELAGYRDYMHTVRYRLAPHVW